MAGTAQVNNQIIKFNKNTNKWVVLKPDGTFKSFKGNSTGYGAAIEHALRVKKYLKRK